MPTLEERLEGGVLGLLIGDALGVPYEFKRAEELPPRDAIEFEPPQGFARSHPRVPAGTWSDDGAQALCLLASLLTCKRFDADDFAQRLVSWFTRGYLAVDGRVFDVGIQTSEVLRAVHSGVPVQRATRRDVEGNGNGALMRVLPLALWHRGSDAELVHDARGSSAVTHGHVRSQLCCALYCLWARQLLGGASDAWARAKQTLPAALPPDDEEAQRELNEVILPELELQGTGTGYVVDTLRTAHGLLAAEATYEGTVKGAVAIGHDTDTTAAVAGGVAAIRSGVSSIPTRWRNALRGSDLVEPLLGQLRTHCAE